MISSLVLAAVLAEPTFLVVGTDVLLPGPPLRIASVISNPTFSRDGQTLIFFDERAEDGYAAEKVRIGRGDPPLKKALVRFDLRRGVREVVYEPKSNETLMRVETVGPAGDVLLSVAVGIPQGDNLTWRGIYAPVGQRPRVLVDGVQARSFHFAGSRTERKAFVLIVEGSGPARYLFVTPESTVEKVLPVTAHQGIVAFRGSLGNPIIGLQGPPPNYSPLGLFELDFASGIFRVADNVSPEDGEETPPRVDWETQDRSVVGLLPGQVPLRDLFARRVASGATADRMRITQGVIATTATSPDGLAVVYLTEEGYFLRELIPASPALRQKLLVGG